MVSTVGTYCNPLNLSYRFQVEGWAKDCLREAADPSIARFRGAYWLFASKSGGYWRSMDLVDWVFIPTRILPSEDYAPDVRVINGELHFTASGREPCTIFKTTDPGSDAWEKVSAPLVYVDPHMFQDDDGRIYIYWGCSNSQPIRGVEMAADMLQTLGQPVNLVSGAPDDHGWERSSEDNAVSKAPFIEGPWMNKHGGLYYLQYSAPGTQWNVYGDGVYVASRPLGPYRYARHNPFSFKPGGFITGAGHGSTFHDEYGNLWHAATMRISVKHDFERRIGVFPAGFDADGEMFCNTAFGDYPTRIPKGKWDPWRDPFCGWMLLSYQKPALASSTLPGFEVRKAFNENIRDYWAANTKKPGEWIQVDLEALCSIHAVQINFAEQDCHCFARDGEQGFHQYLMECSEDGMHWEVAHDRRRHGNDSPHDFITFKAGFSARFLRVTSFQMPGGGCFAVSGFRIFGLAPGEKPEAVQELQMEPDAERLAVKLSWNDAARADGYNVRWGLSPDKLYHSWLLYGQTQLDLRSLSRGAPLWLRVDAFNSCGVTGGVALACR